MILQIPSARYCRPLVFLLLLLSQALSLNAETFSYTYKGTTLNYESIDDKTCQIVSSNVSGDVEIPARVASDNAIYSVTSIGSGAFSYNWSLTSIVIPNSVTYIKGSAFYRCTRLTFINIPNSVTTIGDWAFCECYRLTSIVIPNSVTTIGGMAFKGCTGLTSIDIPNSVTTIGGSAFEGCSSLTSIVIPNSVTSISERLFQGCSGLTSIEIPNSVIYIYEGAFQGCTGLTSIDIPNSVTSIGEVAFQGCTGLTSIEIPNSVTTIGKSAFASCSGLTNINIPVKTIGESAFEGCTGLTSIVVPYSVITINERAFAYCSGLTSIEIPNSVTTIDESAFSNCNNIRRVVYYTEDPIKAPRSVFDDVVYRNATLYLSENAIEKAYDIAPWGLFENVSSLADNLKYSFDDSNKTCAVIGYEGDKPKGHLFIPPIKNEYTVIAIGDKAFQGCPGLTVVDIPNSVTTIGDWAFVDCTGLTSIVIPNSVKTIGSGAFRGCSGLTAIYMPNSVTTIGKSAFELCSGLTSIVIPNSVTSIGNEAFSGCKNIQSVTYDAEDPITADKSVFDENVYSNATLYIPEKTINKTSEILPWSLFENVKSLASLTLTFTKTSDTTAAVTGFNSEVPVSVAIPETITLEDSELPLAVTAITASAFQGNSNLLEIEIPQSITSIGSAAFKNCKNLRKVIFNAESLTTSEWYWSNPVFEGCESLEEITFGPAVVSIPACFFKTAPIKSLVIPDNVVELENDCFASCLNLNHITIGKGVKTIRASAFAFDNDESGVETTIVMNAVGLEQYLGNGIGPNANWLPCYRRNVTKIIFGEDVENVCTYAFCEIKPSVVESLRSTPPVLNDGCLYSTDKKNCELLIPEDSKAAYAAAQIWKEFTNITLSGIESTPSDSAIEPAEIYNLNGIYVGSDTENLSPGIYIERRGSQTSKIIIR